MAKIILIAQLNFVLWMDAGCLTCHFVLATLYSPSETLKLAGGGWSAQSFSGTAAGKGPKGPRVAESFALHVVGCNSSAVCCRRQREIKGFGEHVLSWYL